MPPLDCPFCNHENPVGAKFCNQCGSPLHLAPCEDCGAVNNLGDAHCWRCGALLLPPHAVAQGVAAERPAAPERPAAGPEPAFAAEGDAVRLEQELETLEQEVQALEPPRAPAEAQLFSPEDAPRGPSRFEPRPTDAPPQRVEQPTRSPDIPEPRSLFVQADEAPRRRHRWVATLVVVALGSAIALGAYLWDRDGEAPRISAGPVSPAEPQADAIAPPSAARDLAEAPASTPATPPEPKAVDAAVEPRVASDAGEAPAAVPAPVPAPAPEPTCPPAVTALALCEWLVDENRQ